MKTILVGDLSTQAAVKPYWDQLVIGGRGAKGLTHGGRMVYRVHIGIWYMEQKQSLRSGRRL